MEKIEIEYCANECLKKGYAIAPIGELFPKSPENGDPGKTRLCCCAANAAAAKGKIDQIISELSDHEKGQLLMMILEAGIPSEY